MKTILIVKTSAIGDVIQSFVVLDYLRRKFPQAQIDWVAETACASLLRAHPQLNRVIEIETKRWRRRPLFLSTWRQIREVLQELRSLEYDLVIDLQGNVKSAFVTGLSRARVKLGFDKGAVKERANLLVTQHPIALPAGLSVREKYGQLVQRYFQDNEPVVTASVPLKLDASEQERLMQLRRSPLFFYKPCVMVCFGSRWVNKKISQSTLISLLEKISEQLNPSYLFIFGSQEEEQEARQLQAHFEGRSECLGALSLPLWQAVMREVALVFSMDSAALHLCATTDTPSFGVFGASSAQMYNPAGKIHGFWQGPCPYGKAFVTRCPVLRTCSTGACIHDVDPGLLCAHFLSFWRSLDANLRFSKPVH